MPIPIELEDRVSLSFEPDDTNPSTFYITWESTNPPPSALAKAFRRLSKHHVSHWGPWNLYGVKKGKEALQCRARLGFDYFGPHTYEIDWLTYTRPVTQ